MRENKKYDFLIVGAGFAGASCARLLTDKGYKCLIIEERPFVGGNCLTDRQNDIDIHFLGPHILRTNNEYVWEFLKIYGNIHEYKYSCIAWNNGDIYQLPCSMSLLNKLYTSTWPYECEQELNKDTIKSNDIDNIEDYCLVKFGKKIYKTIYKTYYEKKFNKSCKELNIKNFLDNPEVKFEFNTNLFDEKFQGVPEEGYINMVENIIGDDIDILLNTNFLSNKDKYINLAKNVIYTCELDKFFNYCMGAMNWQSINFELRNESDKTNNLSGVSMINFTDDTVEWYRMTEHKWLTPWRKYDNNEWKDHTFVTYEFFKEWKQGEEAYFPLIDERSVNLNKRYYQKLNNQYPNIYICGGKPKYQFKTICETIEDAFNLVDQIPEKE